MKKLRGLKDPDLVRIATYAHVVQMTDKTIKGLVCSGETQNGLVSMVKEMRGASSCRLPKYQARVTTGFYTGTCDNS